MEDVYEIYVEDYSAQSFDVIVEDAEDVLVDVVEYQGMPGPIGPMGVQGPQGVQGPIGPQGVQGYTGPQGLIGPTGVQGTTGPQGFQGHTGPQGTQGTTGPQGNQGFDGPTGPQGVQGYDGPTGPQGFTGPSVTGPTGIQGPTGPQGVVGHTGPQGNTGPQGETGYSGDSFGIVIQGGDLDISLGYKTLGRARCSGTILGYRIDSYEKDTNNPITSSIDIDVKINGSTIGTASLVSDSTVYDNTLSGWSTNMIQDDKLQYEVISNTGSKNISLTIFINHIFIA